MCGIFGVALKPKQSPFAIRMAMNKVKILGLYNETRGRDSCGMFIDGEIIKGTDKLKEISDFFENTVLPNPKPNGNGTVLGHTRSSTRGAHVGKNAHPFKINDHLVGVHNGVIQNVDTLARKYELDTKGMEVDSEILYALINQEGFSILNEYTGFAALAFTYLDDPNTLYLYHGASRNKKDGDLIEERPMFYMETAEGIYYSSLESSLRAIIDKDDQEIFILEYNTVYQIKSGEFTTSQWAIEREDNNITYVAQGNSCKVSKTHKSNSGKNTGGASTSNANGDQQKVYEPLILKETLPSRCTANAGTNFIYFHHGRFWQAKRTLCHGLFHLLDRGFTSIGGMNASKAFYFYRGVMLKSEEAYNWLVDIEKSPASFVNNKHMNFASNVSKFAKHPVTNLGDNEAIAMAPYHKYAWYLDEKRFNGSFTPKFCGRHYTLVEGLLTSIKSSQVEETLFNDYMSSTVEVEFYIKGNVSVIGGALNEETFQDKETRCDNGVYTNFVEARGNALPAPLTNRGAAVILPGTSDTLIFKNLTKDDEPFYEKKFNSYAEIMEVIKEIDMNGLIRYCTKFLESESPLEPDEKEIHTAACDLLLVMGKNKYSLIELAESEEDKQRLKDAFQYVKDEYLEKEYLEMIRQNEITASKKEMTNDDGIEDFLQGSKMLTMTEQIESDIEGPRNVMIDIVDSLEHQIGEAEMLTGDGDSDLSQDVAAAIYMSTEYFRNRLLEVTDKYNFKDLSEKLLDLNRTRTAV